MHHSMLSWRVTCICLTFWCVVFVFLFFMLKAEQMLNESIHLICLSNWTNCEFQDNQKFKIIGMQRLENKSLFQKFKIYETQVATEVPLLKPLKRPQAIHPWLEKLSKKNDLSVAANTQYLLHGTSLDNLDSIGRLGLRLCHAHSSGMYGQGIYFTDSSCKATQYGDGTPTGQPGSTGCIIICRVVLGNVYELRKGAPGARSTPNGHRSFMARAGFAHPNPNTYPQLHTEYILFDDCACYPEFALTFDLVEE